MVNRFSIDSFRFKIRSSKNNWNTHPDMNLLDMSFGKLRVLDTKEGKRTVIIIPDGPNVIEHHFHLIENLRSKFRVVVVDLPGFGFSTHDGGYDYSYVKTNELLLELLDLINVPDVNIVFPCANGFYGLAFTHTYPEKVKSLTLIQTPSQNEMNNWADRTVPNYLKKPVLGQILMPFFEKKFADKWYDYALPKGVDRKPYSSVALKCLQDGGNFCLCSLTQGLQSQEEGLLYVDSKIPATLVYGAKDFTHKHTDFSSITRYNNKMELICFENSGHFPDLEETDKFAKLLLEKLN